MPLFAIIALKASDDAVDQAVSRTFPENNVYKIEKGKWIVNANATTAKELSVRLGIREAESHLVFPLRGYSGRAQPDLWEWLSAQSEKVDA